jgi:hypothetical protein
VSVARFYVKHRIGLTLGVKIYLSFLKFTRERISVNYSPVVYLIDIYILFIRLRFSQLRGIV